MVEGVPDGFSILEREGRLGATMMTFGESHDAEQVLDW